MSSPSLATSPAQRHQAGPRRRIGVAPPARLRSHAALLAALAQLFPVSFEPVVSAEAGELDGLLVLDHAARIDVPPRVPSLLTAVPSGPRAAGETVRFAREELVARPLGRRALLEYAAPAPAGMPRAQGDVVLARTRKGPVWWRAARPSCAQVSAFPLAELAPGESLRDHLRSGCFMGLVPLLAFLREVCGTLGWAEPPLRACFVIDDPNLRWTSYGFIDFAELIAHAHAHGYHASLAMVPLDGWPVSRRAASLLRAGGEWLSLIMHGNSHVARELGRLSSAREAELALAQALRRVRRFEARSQLRVQRVMVPPHGACSEAVLRAMFGLGFDAACISRPYPWRERLPSHLPLAGWHPAELVAGGMPVLPRYPLKGSREELVFRALLRQPLILYGHHGDLAEGLDVLSQAAADVAQLGDVEWGTLEWIASRSCAIRRWRETLHVRMFSRRLLLDIPQGVHRIKVELPESDGEPLWSGIARGPLLAPLSRASGGWSSSDLEVSGGARVELLLAAACPLSPDQLPRPQGGPRPIIRRVLVEGRDRVRPMLSLPRARA